MTIIELNSSADSSFPSLQDCDVCIIGSGPAGSTIARELSNSGLRVTLLESGQQQRCNDADRLDDIESVGRQRASDQWAVRNRILGGSSHTWGGRCAPFDAIDFEPRSWIERSGWPFDLHHITPYLDRSAGHLGLAYGSGYNDEAFWNLAGKKPPTESLDSSKLLPFFWQFSRDSKESYPFEYMRFGRHLVEQVGNNVSIVTGATVSQIRLREDGERVDRVDFFARNGERRSVRASFVILCAGGIENARILLNSDSPNSRGIGNDRDQVGRYLMDHLRGPVASFSVKGTASLQRRFGRYNVHGHLFRAGFRLSPEVQKQERLLNCAAWLGEVFAEDDPWISLRRVLSRERKTAADFRNILSNSAFIVRGLKEYFLDKNGVPRKLKALNLECMVEQLPDPDSRIRLSDKKDRFGKRLPQLDWRVHAEESHTMRRMAHLTVEQFARLRLPAPELEPWVLDNAEMPATFVDVAHPTGTTRMSNNRSEGVVDSDSRVHGIGGLYICGSSVFPTAGHCNPTQMIVAMAIRLADHVKSKSNSSPPELVTVNAEAAN
ncbi:GMC oxidoreductase [Rhizobium tumorigenes]|uniref:GMC oxidoreductase n=1 Tax=Rhizobium tumorigenes TaxID=2041385 RepID=UPI00241F20B1|nr:GMC family oxidoreductase [Rhizobium tumorigenes]WFS03308.1 GMC family oxidoreductase [Rhizobium tumorigenes]